MTVEKANVGRKIALVSVHRLAEHLYAMSTQKSRYKMSDYNEPLVAVDFRFISVCILACVMSSEFTRDSVAKFLPAQFP